jgi:alkylation response protein AidB-like acyl-CoA dehydrogenase
MPLKDAMTIGKLCLSAQCVGLMQASLEEAIKYSMHRMHFDEPIFNLQAIHWLLAEMASRLEASRWLTYRSAFLKDQGKDTIKEMAITKLFVTSTAVDVCRWGMQVHGAYGISKEYKIERLFRDAKMYELLEGHIRDTERIDCEASAQISQSSNERVSSGSGRKAEISRN